MPKVLVVDDEPRYRDHISRALSLDGHDVQTAASGRTGICVGSRFRPEVLVADWMLQNHVHGLHVSEVLRTVVPELRTILITGFASQDVKSAAGRQRVSKFFEKPFELADLRAAVSEVATAAPVSGRPVPLAVAEVDRDGSITFANRAARELFATTDAGGGAGDLSELFDMPVAELITASSRRWVGVSPRLAARTVWHVRSKECVEGRAWLVVIVPDDEAYLREHSVVRMLLGLEPSGRVRWPLKGRVLVVDTEELVRRALAAQIEYAGGVCHAAEGTDTALQTFERDSGIEVVVLDHDLPGRDAQTLVRRLRAIRAYVRIIGTSAHDRSSDFERMGVKEFLLKPWTVQDLINLLLDRIGHCIMCGLLLPLRRPKPGEEPGHWVCAFCGCRYSALFDNGFSEDVIRNARPAPSTQT
ncbi:MAG: response regulator [Phycisphaerales bacterium]|nr:MAG: response regulator [Phycisphaerales bacterium]